MKGKNSLSFKLKHFFIVEIEIVAVEGDRRFRWTSHRKFAIGLLRWLKIVK